MTTTVGLLGWPVEHSRSPAMHNAAFDALSLDWQYILLPTHPDQLESAIAHLRSGELAGANVTIPHKPAVVPLLDEIDPAAQAMGAVNTIVVRDNHLIGYNTDVTGFRRALIETGIDVTGKSCAVLGAGGSARAVVYALRQLTARITVYARDVVQAQSGLSGLLGQPAPGGSPALWQSAGDDCKIVSLSALAQIDQATVLIVNTTPVGMWPLADQSPWPDSVPFPVNALAFDLIYNPFCTRFMQHARRSGAQAIGGTPMLVYQGVAAFEMWTGCAAPVEVMREAVLR